jgi:hypothetical protein
MSQPTERTDSAGTEIPADISTGPEAEQAPPPLRRRPAFSDTDVPEFGTPAGH